MRLLLVSMPWQTLRMPSLSLGLLRRIVDEALPDVGAAEMYANIQWADALVEAGLPVSLYQALADTVFTGLGDWIFAGALHGAQTWRLAEFELVSSVGKFDRETLLELQRLAGPFLDQLAGEIVAETYDVVGFSSTFMQNIPSLALARRIKELRPTTKIAFGGANMDGSQGAAIHRTYPFVDFVVRGEGENAIVELLRGIRDGTADFTGIGGLCWRDASGTSVANPDGPFVRMDEIPLPNFDAYFAQLDASLVAPTIQPMLVLEAARGCWWGEKHHCKFCGLNQTGMKFRSKQPDHVWSEIEQLVAHHRVLDLVVVDNILDMKYVDTLVPKMESSGWDLRLHYEIKSNMKSPQLRALRDAKIAHVQPGIESLSSRVLSIMDKGVSGAQNIALLREAENIGITMAWNYLFGFPGENDEDYLSILRQFPALIHLQPPRVATRIVIERFSPYFDDPDLGFAEKRPAGFYSVSYDMANDDLRDMVFLFQTPPRGIGNDLGAALVEAVKRWTAGYDTSRLYRFDADDAVIIVDRRTGWPDRDHCLRDSLERQLIDAIETPQSVESLARLLSVSPAQIEPILARFIALGLVFADDRKYVALPTRHDATTVRLPLDMVSS